ncbi:hypothetical protein ABD76_19445 [Paenibacillus dendritiformis]|nr:hypothetical protein [Paenibacillus dendritiformis]
MALFIYWKKLFYTIIRTQLFAQGKLCFVMSFSSESSHHLCFLRLSLQLIVMVLLFVTLSRIQDK